MYKTVAGCLQVCTDETNFNPVSLLPESFLEGRRSYINYFGSLTTPPCTEGVNWYVYTDPIQVADKDIIDFIEWCGGGSPGFNARPVYPLNDREWVLYKEG
jgi:carbonic anhydrase